MGVNPQPRTKLDFLSESAERLISRESDGTVLDRWSGFSGSLGRFFGRQRRSARVRREALTFSELLPLVVVMDEYHDHNGSQLMDRCYIREDAAGGYRVKVTFLDSASATARGFATEAEQWVELRRHERKRLQQ
jgi:hypothetical protein